MQKLYCYADETGQDTKGRMFLVGLVVTGAERDEIRQRLKTLEVSSKKHKLKWTKATLKQKVAYISSVITLSTLHSKLFYSEFAQTTKYLASIAEAIARSIAHKAVGAYKVTVFVDGLGKTERRTLGKHLRRWGIQTEKIRGVRDESDEFIRLADAVAGFVRDHLEGKSYAASIYQQAIQLGTITKL